MVERNRSFLEKIAPYLLFVFTVVSFVVSNSVLVLISVIFAIVGFIFVNTLQLFNKFRYVHYLGLFFSLLLFVRLYLLLDGSLFYKISFAFIILNFVIIYFLHFSNTIAKNTNSLGIKKENTHDKRFDLETDGDDLDDLDDDLKESNFGDDEGEENLGGDHDDEDDYDDEEDDGKDDDGKDD
ncbi:MAG: hypothetical protein PHQ07_02630, partial [Candidatus ainarchaeum sp.]|nr:hypothetical protein [Candidatus ainarchaeum sp.]